MFMTCRFNLFVSIFHFDYYYHYYTCLSDNMELSFQRLELINQFKNLFYLFSDKIDIFPNIKLWLCFVPPEKRRLSMCVGCGSQIHDQFILRVAPDLEWHASCLKCADCNQFLDESCTCFVREGKTYCRKDYVRWESKTGLLLSIPDHLLFFLSLCFS